MKQFATHFRKLAVVYLIGGILLVFPCVLALVVFSFADENNEPPETSQSRYLEIIGENRPSESFLTPDFSSGVSNVRITVREREVDLDRLGFGSAYDDVEVLQIYYGYFSNGEWVDIPCENYDLRSMEREGVRGFKAVEHCHVVQIGEFIILAFPLNLKFDDKVSFATMEDTLKTEMILMDQYFSTEDEDDDFQGYVWLVENMACYGTEDFRPWIDLSFYKWHYLVLDSRDLTEAYSATIRLYQDGESQSFAHSVITYTDIMEMLSG